MILMLLTYWYVPVLLGVGIFVAIKWNHWFGGKGPDPKDRLDDQHALADAQGDAREAELQLQAEIDKRAIVAKYAAKRKGLDAAQEARIKELEDGDDLDALAAEFESATRS